MFSTTKKIYIVNIIFNMPALYLPLNIRGDDAYPSSYANNGFICSNSKLQLFLSICPYGCANFPLMYFQVLTIAWATQMR